MGMTTTWTLAALNGSTNPYSSPWTETTKAAILETPGPKQVDSGTALSPWGERKETWNGFVKRWPSRWVVADWSTCLSGSGTS